MVSHSSGQQQVLLYTPRHSLSVELDQISIIMHTTKASLCHYTCQQNIHPSHMTIPTPPALGILTHRSSGIYTFTLLSFLACFHKLILIYHRCSLTINSCMLKLSKGYLLTTVSFNFILTKGYPTYTFSFTMNKGYLVLTYMSKICLICGPSSI